MGANSKLYNKITLKPALRNEASSAKKYKGFSTVSGDTENYALYDFQLIQQDLLNHFYTKQGERLMNPEFGCIIWNMLFEPMTPDVQLMITQNVGEIINYDPRVSADQVTVTAYDTGIQIDCILTYLPYNLSQAMTLRFDQANGLLIG